MDQFSHVNHYIPQFYLKNWSTNNLRIWTYRLLVSHHNVPFWTQKSISKIACYQDLYTEIDNEKEVDVYEKWIHANIENPVQKSIKKVLKDNPLSPEDWELLARYLGAQDLRTPQSYIESTDRWNKTLPHLLQSKLEESVRNLENKNIKLNDLAVPPIKETELFKDILEIKVVPHDQSKTGQGYISAEIPTGRKLWLQSQKHLLTSTVEALIKNKWSIAYPARGYQWFTSDHPVVKLNFYADGKYDLKGGWGKKGGNIIMPISPRHMLFTQIGEEFPDRLELTRDQTKFFQGLIAERAFRYIFAREPISVISKMRPRHVDPKTFKLEEEIWKNWHKEQSSTEKKKNE